MTRLNSLQPCDFLPAVFKTWDRTLLVHLMIVVMSSAWCAEANQNFTGNTAQEGSPRFQGSLQLAESQMRCDHLLTLRTQHYSLLLASLRLAESMEDSLNNNRHTEELDEFQVARSSYLASWDQVQEDKEKVASSLFPEIISENQCQVGNHCSTNTWDLGCYHCLPGRDGNLPPLCSHNTLSTEFLRVFEKKVRSVQEPLRGRSCIVDSTIGEEMLNVKKQLDSMMTAVNDICSSGNGIELPTLQNIYENAQFLELSSKGLRREIVQQYSNVSVSCDVPGGKLPVNKVEGVSESLSGESGIKITVDAQSPCAKYVFVGGTLISSPSGSCWYINKSENTASSELSTSTSTPALTTSITQNTEEISLSTSTEGSSNTAGHENLTTKYRHCTHDLQEMIDNLHHDVPHIAEDFAQVSLKSAECIRDAVSFSEIQEVIHLLDVFVVKAKEVLSTLEGNIRNRQHPRSATTEERTDYLNGHRKMSASLSSLRSLLEYLRSSAETLQSGSDLQDTKNRVIVAVQHIANMFTQGGAVDHEI
ncbi:uncharacterized protein LOC135208224 [Macrobrachium nipponense]|uniref:uncharacterized protein LOC135208224 n=1 Tax=Macrobrachium nipponense TaxID=159736 RepID=UPI0030C7D762